MYGFYSVFRHHSARDIHPIDTGKWANEVRVCSMTVATITFADGTSLITSMPVLSCTCTSKYRSERVLRRRRP